ncbi:MAG: LysM peptidoglycan-binding domain-containing protein [Bacteroidetes bacterium]|nr:LysM peptidoglycan-binding domain-containing protein [Bacteroidota bacterium]
MRFFAAVLFCFGVAASYAQTPQVPSKIHFAGMVLTIRDDAKREIQKDVDALTKSSRYFTMHAERARTYFPIIEKIFKEENLPEDFKFLSLQESALVADAVSTSNAVGFWQFKDFTAQEMGMRVDDEVDERMNIVSASHGAARYIKQNNWYFNNWVLALQAYQMGKGGVREAVGEKFNGETHMVIDSETYWYVKKFLAYKVAFEEASQQPPQLKVTLYESMGKTKLKEIAEQLSVDEATLKDYNKWAKRGIVPEDKPYTVTIPGGNIPQDFNVLVLNTPKEKAKETGKTLVKGVLKENTESTDRIFINGVEAIRALPNETVSAFASRIGTSVTKFLAYNDISIDEKIRSGVYYFKAQKKKKSQTSEYRSKAGDDLWLVSQQQGIRLRSLKKLNPGIREVILVEGTVVLLNKMKGGGQQIELSQFESAEVATLANESFNWVALPKNIAQREKNNIEQAARQIKNDSLLNDLNDNDKEITRLPNKPADSTKNLSTTIIYEVKSSDTLYGIARQFGATIKELMEWNNKSTFDISPGEKLKIIKR